MTSSSSVVPLRQPDAIDDPLTAVLRSGARRLLAQAIEAEADAFLATMKSVQLRTVVTAWFATAMVRSARCRLASARSRCSG